MANIEVKSDITGSVFKVLVQAGDTVNEGDTLIVLESMKMEIQVTTLDAGRVTEVRVKEGDSVQEGQIVAVLEG
jgi:acetyl-CoA carboxylase biotin carboxyl carrier protein